MVDKPEFEYTTTFQGENVFARVYVNGAPLINHSNLDKMLFTYPMARYLRAGENTITIDYEPLYIPAETFTPHEGVALQVEMRQRGAGVSAEVDLFSARYDEKIGELTPRENRVFGDTPVSVQGGLITRSGQYSAVPFDMNYGGRASSPDSRRVTVGFQINDPSLGTLPWETAPVLTDTPELRQALWESYKALHDASSQRNAEAYLAINEPMMQRLAYVRGYGNTADLANAIWEFSPLGGPDGSSVAPLPSREAFQTGVLRWSADKRMVRLLDDAVKFVDQDGNFQGAYRVMFCQQPDGSLKVCHQMDIPY